MTAPRRHADPDHRHSDPHDVLDRRPDDAATTGLCPLYPLDRQRNADGRRAALQPVERTDPLPPSGIAPLLRKLMADYAATGLVGGRASRIPPPRRVHPRRGT